MLPATDRKRTGNGQETDKITEENSATTENDLADPQKNHHPAESAIKKSHSHLPGGLGESGGGPPPLVPQQRRGITRQKRVIATYRGTWGSPEGVRPLWCRSNVAALPGFSVAYFSFHREKKSKWIRPDLNRGPGDYESPALTD